jgi:hypothetical protein
MLLFFFNRKQTNFYDFFIHLQQEKKVMLPSGFGPESTAREAVMIDRTTPREQNESFYPPEKTCIIVSSCLSSKLSSIGTGILLLITTTVSGLIFNLFKRSITVDPFSNSISFSSFVLETLTFIFT